MKILCIGAHPDDLEIAMGGSIIKWSKSGHELFIVVSMIPYAVNKRTKEVEKSAKILGAKVKFLNLTLDHKILTREIIGIFDKLFEEIKPNAIYTHWLYDSHQDHRIISDGVISAARKNQCDLYMFDQIIPGGIVPYSFRAQKVIDISKYMNMKITALKVHKTQMKKYKNPWLECIKSRANYWGYMIGVKYAEAFEIVKTIEK